jgi:hypothetical protein
LAIALAAPALLIAGSGLAQVSETARLQARPLPLDRVRLTGGPLKQAQDLDAAYLLELEPDRMIAFYRQNAGLEPKAEGYGGWDNWGRQLTGHIAGHHLSGVSLMYAATGDERFKERADYLVAELAEVQAKNGDGFLSALEGLRAAFDRLVQGEIVSRNFDLNDLWSPWYTLHKTYGGLRDAYRFTGNRQALELEIKFAEWAEGILNQLNDEQIQRMLGTEFGGMNEITIDLYADTGDRRWLDLSYKFEHRSFITPLKRHQDDLPGKHGNTQVPKLIGSADRYVLTGDPGDLIAATFFWDTVVQDHSFATGGHGHEEYFWLPEEMSRHVEGRTAETCNIYNMVKLTRRLFAIRPDVHYSDFHERALFNHILGSIDPENGATCYMVPVGVGVRREYANMTRSFTCCVGSGMESHALHGDGLYYESGDKLWVNLYAPSTADWSPMGAKIETRTDFPEGESATIEVSLDAPKRFTLAVRRPYWAREGFEVRVNGERVHAYAAPARRGGRRGGGNQIQRPQVSIPSVGEFIEIRREWRGGDKVEVALPKTLRLEPLPDNPNRVAIMWGPLVLAGDLSADAPEGGRGRGRRGEGRRGGEARPSGPVLAAQGRPVEEWLKPIEGRPNEFRTDGVVRRRRGEAGERAEIEFVPFHRLHRKTYGVYFELVPDAR